MENQSIERACYAGVFVEDFPQDLLHCWAVHNDGMNIEFLPSTKAFRLASNEGIFLCLFILGCFGRIFGVLVKPLCATLGIFWALVEILNVVDRTNGGTF
jgi:hypothetical protein